MGERAERLPLLFSQPITITNAEGSPWRHVKKHTRGVVAARSLFFLPPFGPFFPPRAALRPSTSPCHPAPIPRPSSHDPLTCPFFVVALTLPTSFAESECVYELLHEAISRSTVCELKPPNEPATLPWRPGRLPSRYWPQHKITLTICLGPLMRHTCGNQFYPTGPPPVVVRRFSFLPSLLNREPSPGDELFSRLLEADIIGKPFLSPFHPIIPFREHVLDSWPKMATQRSRGASQCSNFFLANMAAESLDSERSSEETGRFLR